MEFPTQIILVFRQTKATEKPKGTIKSAVKQTNNNNNFNCHLGELYCICCREKYYLYDISFIISTTNNSFKDYI